MPSLCFDSLHIMALGRDLAIQWGDSQTDRVTLQGAEIEELIDFLISVRPVASNQRQAFRIPLWKTCGLSAALETAQGLLPVRPRNISLTGILVELPSPAPVVLEPGSDVQLVIRMDGPPQRYTATVKRRTARGYGLCFNESVVAGRVDPPGPLREDVMELQRRWTAGRVIGAGETNRDR